MSRDLVIYRWNHDGEGFADQDGRYSVESIDEVILAMVNSLEAARAARRLLRLDSNLGDSQCPHL